MCNLTYATVEVRPRSRTLTALLVDRSRIIYNVSTLYVVPQRAGAAPGFLTNTPLLQSRMPTPIIPSQPDNSAGSGVEVPLRSP